MNKLLHTINKISAIGKIARKVHQNNVFREWEAKLNVNDNDKIMYTGYDLILIIC